MKQKRLLRIMSFVLAFIMLLEIGPMHVFATGKPPAEEVPEIPLPEITAPEPVTEMPEVYIEGEVQDLRNEYEKHYRLTDGSFMAVQYQVPVHYEDDGQWVDIDNTLEPVTMFSGDTVYQAVNGENVQAFASDLSDGSIMTMATDDHMISMSIWTYDSVEEAAIEDVYENSVAAEDDTEETEPVAPQESVPEEPADSAEATEASDPDNELVGDDALAEEEWTDMAEVSLDAAENVLEDTTIEDQQDDAIVAQILTEEVAEDSVENTEETEHWELDDVMPDALSSSILYEDVFPGVDLRYDTFSYNVKESIILKQPMDLDEYAYSFLLNLDGLEPELQEDGSILLLDDDYEVQYTIPAPYMWDAENVYSDAVFYELEENDNGWVLTVCADENWLEDEERRYPVTIDPSYTKTVSTLDFSVAAEKKTPNSSSDSAKPGDLSCGYSTGYGRIQGYVKFVTLPKIPVGSTIIESKLQPISESHWASAACRMDVYMLQEALSSSEWNNYVAWNDRPEAAQTAMDFIYMPKNGSPSLKPNAWDITPAVMQWYADPSTNFGITIKPETDAAETNVNAYCRFSDDTAYWTVRYRNTVGTESFYTYETQSASRAGTGYVGDFTSELTVFKSDLSYSSTTIPFSLSHVFNSVFAGKEISAFEFDDTYAADYSNMKFGNGWQLSVQESVFYRNYGIDGDLVYRDSDGTLHYFKWDPNTSATYVDEDGLGLKIVRYAEGPEHTYKLKDQSGNTKSFYHNMLYCIKDGNGNAIYFLYNGNPYSSSSTNWRPTGTDDRLTQIVAVNKGQNAEVICTLAYNSSNQLSQITDYVARKTLFTYTNGNLTKITHPDGTAAHYAYDSNGQLIRMYDDEAAYGIEYGYDAGGVCAVHEYTAASINGNQTRGVQVERKKYGIQEVRYQYNGDDREFRTDDDIINCYYFDYIGRTINAVTLDSEMTKILGVTSDAYLDTSDASNNKIKMSAQSGQNGVNMLSAGGLEIHDGYTPGESDWKKVDVDSYYNAIIKNNELARTGTGSLKTWISTKATNNATRIEAKDTKRIAIKQKVNLLAGKTYTVSAYVNTQNITAFNGGGAYVAIMDANDKILSTGDMIDYTTSLQIDNGWQRVYATFECSGVGPYYVAAVQDNAYGSTYFDDFQLEEGYTPSCVNLLQNGSFTTNTNEWDKGEYTRDVGSENHTGVLRVTGIPDENYRASQEIPIGKSCVDQSFLLSGWGKAASAADCKTDLDWHYSSHIENKNDKRYYGLIAQLHYRDSANEPHSEYFYAPFNDDYDNWQFTSCIIAPGKYYQDVNMTLESIEVYVVYDNNFNTVSVDNISLRQEPSTTYTYNADGIVTAVNASGTDSKTVEYVSGTTKPTTVRTNGSGVYYYQYYDTNNTYLPSYISNAATGVYTYYKYDKFGNNTETHVGRLVDDVPSGYPKLKSFAAYSDDGSQLKSETNVNGQKTHYTYTDERQLRSVCTVTDIENDTGTTVLSSYHPGTDRTLRSYISNEVSVEYQYENGLLSTIIRGGYYEENNVKSEKQNQYYNISYDSFGNMTEVSIGEDVDNDLVLASYSYGSKNNHLNSISYRNDTSITYTYDKLGRMIGESWSDDTDYRYFYNAEGALVKKVDATNPVDVDNGTADAVNYQYDSLGRLIHSSASKDGVRTILTEHLYDRANRIDKQTYQLRNSDDTFTTYASDYSYRASDGALTYVQGVGFTDYAFSYDDVARLSARYNYYFRQDYTYRNIDSSRTTTQIEKIAYSKRDGGTNFNPFSLAYTYDDLGNIETITGEDITGQNAAYEYDIQGQLTQATTNGVTRKYIYDTYGNIREIRDASDNTLHSYSYGNADWKDLLTKYDTGEILYEGQTSVDDTPLSGNPISYYNGTRWNFGWAKGRQLVKAESDNHEIEYTYDMAGIRDSKTVDDVTYNYLTLDGKVVRQTWGNNTLDIIYDNSGLPYAFKYAGGYYLYVLNQQGDVIRIVDSTGETVDEYSYDAWGNILVDEDDLSDVGQANPIRYRGYYYDTETGFYYLQSRYYDPSIGRFINADSFASTGQGFLGYNMFAYCGNNPVNNTDPTGHASWGTNTVAIADGYCGFFPGSAEYAIKERNRQKVWKNTLENLVNTDNTDEQVVLDADLLAFYNGRLFLKVRGESGLSFGIVFFGEGIDDPNLVRHEYGHTVQLKKIGLADYISKVAIPSLCGYILNENKLLPPGLYYNLPWEYTADVYGGVTWNHMDFADEIAAIYWFFS